MMPCTLVPSLAPLSDNPWIVTPRVPEISTRQEAEPSISLICEPPLAIVIGRNPDQSRIRSHLDPSAAIDPGRHENRYRLAQPIDLGDGVESGLNRLGVVGLAVAFGAELANVEVSLAGGLLVRRGGHGERRPHGQRETAG